MNTNPTLTMAGVWAPVDTSYLTTNISGSTVVFAGLVKIGSTGQYGVVANGWVFQGSFGGTKTAIPVKMALLTPDANGIESINTSSYISDPTTNGSGSVIVADFNGDGKDDIFLAAHNESPFVALSSTAYLSNSSGGYTKVTLSDHVMAHDAELVYIDGKPAVSTMTFQPGDVNPIFRYIAGSFVETMPENNSTVGGMDSTIVNNSASKSSVIARGDIMTGWSSSTGYVDTSTINVYAFNGSDIVSTTPVQTITPYLSSLPQYQNTYSEWGKNITHVYRVWADDLNNDGKEDMIAGESMWNSKSQTNWPSALQLLINMGDNTFKDMTATLNSINDYDCNEYDYNPTFVDLDHSGINTYCFSSFSWSSLVRQSNYVMLNDGTGHLYIGVHDQLSQILPQVFSYTQQQAPSFGIDPSSFPKFMAVPQDDGSLNFVAMVNGGEWIDAAHTIWQGEYAFVNVPLHYNPTTDFRDCVTISDRNSSKLMRTWAGNDTIYDTGANANACINGGLGIDKCVYSGSAGSYAIARNADGLSVISNSSLTDTLTNIERVQFSDITINLTAKTETATIASSYLQRIEELYVAFFNRVPDADGLVYWVNQFKNGMTLNAVADSFYDAGVAHTSITGYSATMSDSDFVKKIYANVLGRTDTFNPPPAADVEYWANNLANHTATRGGLVDSILTAAHGFKGDSKWGWVPDLLDNKIVVANKFAVDYGINYNTADDSIKHGIEIAAAVTSTDTTAAIALIGVHS